MQKGRAILTIVKPHHKEPKDIHNNNVAEDFTHTYIHMHVDTWMDRQTDR